MTLLKRIAVVALTGVLAFGGVPLAHAAFRDTASAESSFSAATLAAPTTLLVAKRCTLSVLGVVISAALDLTWTVSTSTWATGQSVVVKDATGVAVATKSVGPTVSSTTVDLPLVTGGTYTATVVATYSSWTSAKATATSAGC